MTAEQTKWKKEISAGGVVYKIGDNPASVQTSAGRSVFVLLIRPKSRDFGPPEDYWCFPKGKQDIEGEDLKQVAIREVREEGGVNAEIDQELGYIKYFRNWKGDEALKFVTYFLMKYTDGDPADHDEEVVEADWFRLEEVDSKLKFDTDKEIFNKAKKFLN